MNNNLVSVATRRKRARWLLPLLGLLLTGCSYSLGYNPAYLAAARRPANIQAEGNALIYTTPQEDLYAYSGSPTTLTGSATTAAVPLGIIVREAARAAFADTFRGGAEVRNTLDRARDFRVIIEPRPIQYSYQYNQLRNLGFAITPSVDLQIDVRVLDASGGALWQRSYKSGEVTGSTYLINLKPEQEINKVTHKAAYDLMVKAAADIAREVVPPGPGAERKP